MKYETWRMCICLMEFVMLVNLLLPIDSQYVGDFHNIVSNRRLCIGEEKKIIILYSRYTVHHVIYSTSTLTYSTSLPYFHRAMVLVWIFCLSFLSICVVLSFFNACYSCAVSVIFSRSMLCLSNRQWTQTLSHQHSTYEKKEEKTAFDELVRLQCNTIHIRNFTRNMIWKCLNAETAR